jgi:hypothetical protein
MIGFEEQKRLMNLIGSECRRKVEAVIIGGSAMLFYDFHKTATKDIDMVLFSEDDRKYLVGVLKRVGFELKAKPGRENEPYSMIFKDYIMDVFAKSVFKLRMSDGIMARVKEKIDFGNLGVSVISPEDIILSKSMTDRKGDRDDAASVISTININWNTIIKECIWQSENGDPRFCVYLYDFLDDLVHDFGIEIPKDVTKKVKQMFREFMDKTEIKTES